MKITTIPIIVMFMASVLILPVGMSYAQTGNVIAGKIGYMAQASDGTTVLIITTAPITGQSLVLGIGFKDNVGNFVKNQNYAMTVTQDNDTILSVPNAHTDSGTDTQNTQTLSSTDQINIRVTLLGVGFTTTLPSDWKGVKGEVLSFSQTSPTTTSSAGDNQTTMAPMNNTMTPTNSTVSLPVMNNTVTPTNSTVSLPVMVKPEMLLPLEQVKAGVAPKDVQCKPGFTLILKAEDGSPACVDPTVAQILAQRGW